MTHISERDFIAVAESEGCSAVLDERMEAVSPDYIMYSSPARKFLDQKTFPPWRTTHDASQYVFAYQVSRSKAFPISYFEVAQKPHLFASIKFDITRDYFLTNRIIVFHCQSCGIRLVKDGNHRLLQCVLKGSDPELQVYEVTSHNWFASQIDMKNFCECFSNNTSK